MAIAAAQGEKLVALAKEIAKRGYDPASAFFVTERDEGGYTVREGNRRLCALRALADPECVPNESRLRDKIKRIVIDIPLPDSIPCVIYSTEEEDLLVRRLEIRHGGEQGGAGVVGWGTAEQARFGVRGNELASQLLNFASRQKFFTQRFGSTTTLTRLLSNPVVREALGLDMKRSVLLTKYSSQDISPPIQRVLEDLSGSNGREKMGIGEFRTKGQRENYADNISKSFELPEVTVSNWLPLDQLQPLIPQANGIGSIESVDENSLTPQAPEVSGVQQPTSVSTSNSSPASGTIPTVQKRTTLVPRRFTPDPDLPRLRAMLQEMKRIKVADFPNLCAISLRVFLEGVVDDYRIEVLQIDKEREWLKVKVISVANSLKQANKLTPQQLDSILKFANQGSVGLIGLETLNKFQHNPYIFTDPKELQSYWDYLEEFLRKAMEHQSEAQTARGGRRR